MSARDKANRVLIHVILILVSITMLVPFLWMILTAFKTMTEATSVNPFVILPSTWRWDSFKEVIENMDFLHLYLNTLLLILGRVICAVLTATLAGYAFGRLNFKGKNLMFSLVLFFLNRLIWDFQKNWKKQLDLMAAISVRHSSLLWRL